MKNLLLLSAVVLTSVNTIAQLYVQPNGANESYLYVDNIELFVTQDVNLVKNNPGSYEASIYLRNEAQLLQGNATVNSANTGTGFVSVYQDSNSDSYDYNFWCSPVGNPTAATSAAPSTNKNFGILSYYDPVDPGFTLPTQATQTLYTNNLNGVASPNLTISRRWIYTRYAGPNYTFVGHSNNIPAGMGFTMKGVGVTSHGDPYNEPMNQIYDFRGRPNNGNIAVAVLDTESTLSGNPYPSALDLNLFFYEPGNEEIMSIRYWDEDRSVNSHNYTANKGGYGTWIPGPMPYTTGGSYVPPNFYNYDSAGNQTTDTGVDGIAVRRVYAPIGQGFNIYAEDPGGSPDYQVTFKNSHRLFFKESDASGNSVFRNPTENQSNDPSGSTTVADPSAEPVNEYPPTLRIQSLFGESHFRELMLVLWPESTDGYDRGLDARHPMDGVNSEAYFPIGSDNESSPYVIQTVPYEMGKRIPITFHTTVSTPVTIKSGEETNLPAKAWLWDSGTNVYQEITGGNEANLQLHPGTYEGRYYIVFRGKPAEPFVPTTASGGKAAQVRENLDFFQNNPIAELEVSNPEGYDIKAANIFDMSGKLVLSRSNLGTDKRLSFSTATFSDGVYIVKMTTVDDITIDYKISVFNRR